MTLNEYQELALRTAPDEIASPNEGGGEDGSDTSVRSLTDLLHGAAGACTEAGELMDIVKKKTFYGKSVDWTNVIEESGDILWYLAIVARASGVSLDQIAAINIAKLRARYPNRFETDKALNRDLESERRILEETP